MDIVHEKWMPSLFPCFAFEGTMGEEHWFMSQSIWDLVPLSLSSNDVYNLGRVTSFSGF